jgi:hypothetical protein
MLLSSFSSPGSDDHTVPSDSTLVIEHVIPCLAVQKGSLTAGVGASHAANRRAI